MQEISIAESIQSILRTQKGTRIMRPGYGIDWQKYIDKNPGEIKLDLIEEIISALEENEPRFKAEGIQVKQQKNIFFVKANGIETTISV